MRCDRSLWPTKQDENPQPSSTGITASTSPTAATATTTSWPVIRASALLTADRRVSALGAPKSWGCRWHIRTCRWPIRPGRPSYFRHCFGRRWGSWLWAALLVAFSIGLLLTLPLLLLGRLLGHSIHDRHWAGCSRTILLPPYLRQEW